LLKILFLANRIPYPVRDGQARRTYHVLRGLAERHDVHLLSMYESAEEARPETLAHLRSFCARVDVMPAPRKDLSLPMLWRLLRSVVSVDPYTVWRHYSAAYARRVEDTVKAEAFDLVHCDILPIVYAVRRLDTRCLVLTDHDVSHLKARRLARQRRNPAAKLFIHYEATKLRRLERLALRAVDLGVVVSDLDRRSLETLCADTPLAVVENGVDVEAFVPRPSVVVPNTLVWVGGFQHHSNYEAVRYFLETIYPSIRRAQDDVTLTIVGSDPPPSLQRLIRDDPSVSLTGYVDDPLPHVQRAAVFVAPILSGGGTKLKVLEAMAAGKAIVSTTIGVEGIHGVDGEAFLIADRPDAFADAVVTLLRDADRCGRLGASARRIAETRYDWRAICDGMSAVYERAASRARAGG